MYEIKCFISKYSYIFAPFFGLIIFFLLLTFLPNLFDLDYESYKSNIISLSGTLAGFLLTIFVMFFSLNQNTRYMEKLKKHGHHEIFKRCVGFGLTFFVLVILLSFFKLFNAIYGGVFICGISEMILAIYYIFTVTSDNN